jgi:hypothetical protein
MKNLFIIYIPPSNHEALVHYEDTIRQKVSSDLIYRHVDAKLQSKLSNIFGPKRIATWGSRDSKVNRARFERMQEGDDILIVEGATIKLLGKLAAKTINPDLSRELWKDLRGQTAEGWGLIYFIANPMEIDIPFAKLAKLFDYSPDYLPRGFSNIAEDKLSAFYEKYDDLYSILVRIKQGLQYEKRPKDKEIEQFLLRDKSTEHVPIIEEDIEEVLNSNIVSDHVKMQWKLARLGLKTGSKVWIPVNDQAKLKKIYEFNNFESNITAGLDTPAKYVENIDVIWKEEFRIDAAFEIENTTAIYSGLLRFTDLSIVAPNTIYPLFIVAPTEKKNRLMEQLRRPTFKKFELDKKVNYLSYEAVDQIDDFFAYSSSGLSVDLIKGKAELLQLT